MCAVTVWEAFDTQAKHLLHEYMSDYVKNNSIYTPENVVVYRNSAAIGLQISKVNFINRSDFCFTKSCVDYYEMQQNATNTPQDQNTQVSRSGTDLRDTTYQTPENVLSFYTTMIRNYQMSSVDQSKPSQSLSNLNVSHNNSINLTRHESIKQRIDSAVSTMQPLGQPFGMQHTSTQAPMTLRKPSLDVYRNHLFETNQLGRRATTFSQGPKKMIKNPITSALKNANLSTSNSNIKYIDCANTGLWVKSAKIGIKTKTNVTKDTTTSIADEIKLTQQHRSERSNFLKKQPKELNPIEKSVGIERPIFGIERPTLDKSIVTEKQLVQRQTPLERLVVDRTLLDDLMSDVKKKFTAGSPDKKDITLIDNHSNSRKELAHHDVDSSMSKHTLDSDNSASLNCTSSSSGSADSENEDQPPKPNLFPASYVKKSPIKLKTSVRHSGFFFDFSGYSMRILLTIVLFGVH
jgi:hypothetical protein